MRLDLFLKKTCVLKSRTVAKAVCDGGAVTVNGKKVRASQEVRAGDVVRLRLVQRDLEFRVLDEPHGNVAKRDAGRYFEIVHDRPVEPRFGAPDPDP